MHPQRKIPIDLCSAVSVFLETLDDAGVIGSATGFIIEKGTEPYLVTNWHVVTGVNPLTNATLSNRMPREIRIWRHRREVLGDITPSDHPLYDPDEKPLWREHPLGQRIDVIAMPLGPSMHHIHDYPLDLGLAATDMRVFCGTSVSIVGFPLGLRARNFPIWKTGHVASEPEIDAEELPMFFIDATTRPGMSGSPVYARTMGPFMRQNLSTCIHTGVVTRFLGVYSGRIHDNAEIGRVWKPSVINDIVG